MDFITARSGAVLWDVINRRSIMTRDEVLNAVLADLVRNDDSMLGSLSHRLHISCQVLIDVLHENKDTIWIVRKAPLRETVVGLTSMGMAKATEDAATA